MKATLEIDAPKRTGDAGYDLHCSEDVDLLEGETHDFETAAVAIPEGFCGLIIGRSSLNHANVVCVFGLVDSGYRGKIRVKLYRRPASRLNQVLEWFSIRRTSPYKVKAGDRIAQLVIVPHAIFPLEYVEDLETDTERGGDGFGSTGK